MLNHNIRRIRPKEEDTYALEDSYALTEEQKKDYLVYMEDNVPWERLPTVARTFDFIRSLEQAGHTIEFVTSRSKFLRIETENWIRSNLRVKLPVLYFTEKGDALKPDLLIDNSEVRCRCFQERGIPVLLFTGVLVATENKKSRLSKKLPKASTWVEALKFIKKLSKEIQ